MPNVVYMYMYLLIHEQTTTTTKNGENGKNASVDLSTVFDMNTIVCDPFDGTYVHSTFYVFSFPKLYQK